MILDRDVCYRAIQARDPRFDGRLFIGVRSTGIYCRPICPARLPKFENVEFYATAAAAQEAGFRPCLRCRPETSPDLAVWRGSSNTVSRALALIAEGALDGEDASVDALALRLGVGERQLRRLFHKHLGASPIAVAQTRRVHFAKALIHDTQLKMTDVALASGFGSLRRFNDTFHKLYGRPPSTLRRSRREEPTGAGTLSGITLTLGYAAPYDWPAMTAFLAQRAIAGVEVVTPDVYRRAIGLDGRHGTIEVRPIKGKNALAATIRFPDVKAFPAITERIKRIFDLGADIGTITTQLSRCPFLGPRVAARPGLRVTGAWDGFELAVRAVLGQQITVAAARSLAGKLVGLWGEPLAVEARLPNVDLSRVFPEPRRLARADLTALGMPARRIATLAALAEAAAADPRFFATHHNLADTMARLSRLPGIGDWTAQYVAMRALREPDAFPAADVGLQRGAADANGERPSAEALLAMAEDWRPWRAYAAQHLWAHAAAGDAGDARHAIGTGREHAKVRSPATEEALA